MPALRNPTIKPKQPTDPSQQATMGQPQEMGMGVPGVGGTQYAPENFQPIQKRMLPVGPLGPKQPAGGLGTTPIKPVDGMVPGGLPEQAGGGKVADVDGIVPGGVPPPITQGAPNQPGGPLGPAGLGGGGMPADVSSMGAGLRCPHAQPAQQMFPQELMPILINMLRRGQ